VFYLMAAASRPIQALQLEDYGLSWTHPPTVLAHPLSDERAAVLSRDLDRTAAALDGLGAGDGAAWRRLYQLWQRVGPHLLDALFVPFPRCAPGCGWLRRLAQPACRGLCGSDCCRCAS
jgi:phytoene dehydrogenase-like protein